MDTKFGYYAFGGLLIGALFGLIWAGGGNPLEGLCVGALIGTAIGWFFAAYVLENQKKELGAAPHLRHAEGLSDHVRLR